MSAPPQARNTAPQDVTANTTRFRCSCGRSVATTPGSAADRSQRCSRCRRPSRDEHLTVE